MAMNTSGKYRLSATGHNCLWFPRGVGRGDFEQRGEFRMCWEHIALSGSITPDTTLLPIHHPKSKRGTGSFTVSLDWRGDDCINSQALQPRDGAEVMAITPTQCSVTTEKCSGLLKNPAVRFSRSRGVSMAGILKHKGNLI